MQKTFFITLLLAGCSNNSLEIQNNDNFKVSATSNGEKVSANDQSLIQRVELSSTELLKIKSQLKGDLIFGISNEKDVRGNSSGLKILTIKDRLVASQLGLERGDVVLAAHISELDQKQNREIQMPLKDHLALYDSFSRLSKERSLSLSVIRSGMPHKIYYFLN